jgi:DNA-binding transcriptional ArsR family regulator
MSQHLMALPDAGVMTARRGGRFVFYRLQDGAPLVSSFGAAVIVCEAARVMGWGA